MRNAGVDVNVVEITHPFHPFRGRRFRLCSRWKNWGGDRVIVEDEEGGTLSVPTAWTSVAGADPFVVLSQGRSLFRPGDLLQLVGFIREHGEV